MVVGFVADVVSVEFGHVVGLNSRGFIFCSWFGDSRANRSIREEVELVPGRVGRVWQVWYMVLPRGEVIGMCLRVMVAEGFPSWH